jgi:hypothetical protein
MRSMDSPKSALSAMAVPRRVPPAPETVRRPGPIASTPAASTPRATAAATVAASKGSLARSTDRAGGSLVWSPGTMRRESPLNRRSGDCSARGPSS